MIVILIGAPGSGKGTQASILSSEIGLKHISTGDVLRKYASSETEEGRVLRDLMKGGMLVPSDMVNLLILKELESNVDCILDGYPRNVAQAEFLASNYSGDLKVIYLNVSEELLIQRITGRFSCKKCGKIYNKYLNRPQKDNECDVCGCSEFVVRNDDDSATLVKRIEEYKKETMPLIKYYQERVGVVTVDASKTLDKITSELLFILKRH